MNIPCDKKGKVIKRAEDFPLSIKIPLWIVGHYWRLKYYEWQVSIGIWYKLAWEESMKEGLLYWRKVND